MESFSLYIHIFSRSESFLSCVEKKLWDSKNPENGLFKKSQPIKKDKYFFFNFYIKTKWLIKNLPFVSIDLIKYFTK